MTDIRASLTALDQQLAAQARQLAQARIVDRIHREPVAAFVAEGAGVLLDFKKHLIDQTAFDLLLRKAELLQLHAKREALFCGEQVNVTEQRAALHTLLRTPADHVPAALQPQHADVMQVQQRMRDICTQVRQRQWRGFTGKAIDTVVSIGIGGSDLGPRMAYRALAPCTPAALRCHFVANIDPAAIATTLHDLDPQTTLFVVASKSFTTQETLANALTARDWLRRHGADDAGIGRHFIAITARPDRAIDFGIDAAHVLPMWDWVGGRFSLWSAIGLPLAMAVGMDQFDALLAGAFAMDQHFRHAAPASNLPLILALLEHWYVGFWQGCSHAILPYAEQLELLPAYLQQLAMESLGKRTRSDGSTTTTGTGPVLWGTAGTNGQHSYYQLLHQGTPFVSCDFIVPLQSDFAPTDQHRLLVANAFAQARVLMTGQTEQQALTQLLQRGIDPQLAATLARHKAMPGNRPSSTLLVERIDARTLGALIALYEHKTYCASVLWDINAFDQWGVELGKEASVEIAAALAGGAEDELDASTRLLVQRFRDTRH